MHYKALYLILLFTYHVVCQDDGNLIKVMFHSNKSRTLFISFDLPIEFMHMGNHPLIRSDLIVHSTDQTLPLYYEEYRIFNKSQTKFDFEVTQIRDQRNYGLLLSLIYTRESPTVRPVPFLSDTILPSNIRQFKWNFFHSALNSRLIDSPKPSCGCDLWGTWEIKYCMNVTLNQNNKQCECKDGHTGEFCNQCAVGFFRKFGLGPCLNCPCQLALSDKFCRFFPSAGERGEVICRRCLNNVEGVHCDQCPTGSYRQLSRCVPCECHGSPSRCEVATGRCTDCLNNTRGHNCQFCSDSRLDWRRIKPPFCHEFKSEPKSAAPLTQAIIVLAVIGSCLAVGLVGWYLFALRRRNLAVRRETLMRDACLNDSDLPPYCDDMDDEDSTEQYCEKI